MKTIILTSPELGRIEAELWEDKAPETCKRLWDALPLEVDLSRWGDELYGSIPVEIPPENPTQDCEVGDLAYWLDGSGFCILFGPTPVSKGNKPRLISPGNVFGHIKGDPSVFKKFSSLHLRIERGS